MIYNYFINSSVGKFLFSLLSGIAYFMILMYIFIVPMSGNNPPLIGWFFSPAIICGSALILLKTINKAIELENKKQLLFLLIIHLLIIIMGLFFGVSLFY